jgi:acetolactate synthase-1/2/3 large subunit
VVALVGDGAFQLLGPELSTLADAGIAVLYVVLHNGGYGWLQANLDRATATGAGGGRFGFLTPGRTALAGLAGTYGLAYAKVASAGALEPALRQAWAACQAGRSAVVEVVVDRHDAPPGMAALAGDLPASTSTSEVSS